VWIAIPVSALWGFYSSAAQTLMTQKAPANAQGQLQGALGSLMGIASMISPPLYTGVFAAAIDWKGRGPALGAPFFVAAGLLVAAVGFAARATRPTT
jgi:DHA1 family tetracycline resistance protein-like MFS transporter